MQQLGIRQVFARSSQAKGRVERTAGTFQDRLVTGLRLARGATIDDANEDLHRYLPQFDRQFGVPAAQSEVAYSSSGAATAVEQILCFRWRTLQLLPDPERPSYAGVQVEVLERPDGQMLAEYKGRTIPTREAPPRPSLMRVLSQTLRHRPSHDGSANGSGSHHRPLAALETLGTIGATSNLPSRARTREAPTHRKPPLAKRARRQVVPDAKTWGQAIRVIGREPVLHRSTAPKYEATETRL